MPTTAERHLLPRLASGQIGEAQLRWLLRQPSVNGVVRPQIHAALQRQVQARFKQARSRFSWAAMLEKAYRVTGIVDFDVAAPRQLAPISLWVPPMHLPWLAAQRRGLPGAEVVVYRDRPLVCLCVEAGSEAVTSLLVKKRPKPKRESDESLRARARKDAEAVFHHGAQDLDEPEIDRPAPVYEVVAR